ncbi:hypothetical protein [Nocardia cerradoensis]|uniref:Uncharacterized protein n=1 Tax=Nocardia cerradoensis TaxID=85688 RepID=A0A231GTH1_9NOCA|nr:hypothetical protein [Nocardia cerradoensis]NKY47996.1 hypothetical protein [Nocardia cerradoensis]OXR39920.1 hypothetical protein B7C42_08025 [Nocardia cerradoensis]
MTATITTPAALIAAALGIDADDRVRIEVTRDGWDNAMCEETGAPGAVEVEWVTVDGDRTDRTFAGDIAGDHINALLLSDQVDQYETITVKVCRAYLRFVHPQLADTADRVDMPARIAA